MRLGRGRRRPRARAAPRPTSSPRRGGRRSAASGSSSTSTRTRRTRRCSARGRCAARAGAQVSTPLRWDEIDDVHPDELTIATVPARLEADRRPVGRHERPPAVARAAARHCTSATAPTGCMDAPWPPVYPKQPDEPPASRPAERRRNLPNNPRGTGVAVTPRWFTRCMRRRVEMLRDELRTVVRDLDAARLDGRHAGARDRAVAEVERLARRGEDAAGRSRARVRHLGSVTGTARSRSGSRRCRAAGSVRRSRPRRPRRASRSCPPTEDTLPRREAVAGAGRRGQPRPPPPTRRRRTGCCAWLDTGTVKRLKDHAKHIKAAARGDERERYQRIHAGPPHPLLGGPRRRAPALPVHRR